MMANVQDVATRTFGEAYTYTPVGGSVVTGLTGIFREAHTEESSLLEERSLITRQPMIDVRLSDLPSAPARGDLVTVTRIARSFEVEESQEDGEGMSKLLLIELP